MHVVEATLYYSAGLVPVLMGGLHPVVALAWIVDCAVGAWLGHDGFQVYMSQANSTVIISVLEITQCQHVFQMLLFSYSGLEAEIIFITYTTNILIAIMEQPMYLWINFLEPLLDVSTTNGKVNRISM